MAKFCTNCGKPLPESGICDCQANAADQEVRKEVACDEPVRAAPAGDAQTPQEAASEQDLPETASESEQTEAATAPEQISEGQQAQQSSIAPAAPVDEGAFVKKTKQATGETLSFIKAYFGDPAGATAAALKGKNWAVAIIMMALSAVFSGLMVLTSISKAMGGLGRMVRSSFGRVDIDVPFFAPFFAGVAIAIVVLALSMLALFALLRIVKVKVSFEYIVIAVGVNALLCAAFTALAWLCMLVGLTKVALAVLVLGGIFWGALGVAIAMKVFDAKFTSVLTLLYTVFFGIVLFLNLWAGSKLVVGAVGKVKVEDVEISEAVEELEDQLEDVDAEDIFRGIGQMISNFAYYY